MKTNRSIRYLYLNGCSLEEDDKNSLV